jgi:polysaccharide biosynthesis/export protein
MSLGQIFREASRTYRLAPANALRAVVLLLTLPVLTLTATAQFTGPALPVSTYVNPTLTPTTDPAILYPPTRGIKLDTGDTIGIHLFGAPDYTPVAQVGLEGSIQLPLIGLVPVKDLTVPQAERLIAGKLVAAGMYRDPQVSIQITESPNQVATVIGEAHGVVPVAGGRRLFDALVAAGGLPPTASHIITIDRPGVSQPIIIDLGTDPSRSAYANVPIFAHDTIIVPRVGTVYLLGSFKTPTSILLQQDTPMTLLKITSLGGGTTVGSKLSDLRIIRTNGQSRTVIRVDIKKIMDGKEPDPVLQADDIVYLPNSVIKEAIEVGGIGTLLGIVSLLIFSLRG